MTPHFRRGWTDGLGASFVRRLICAILEQDEPLHAYGDGGDDALYVLCEWSVKMLAWLSTGSERAVGRLQAVVKHDGDQWRNEARASSEQVLA